MSSIIKVFFQKIIIFFREKKSVFKIILKAYNFRSVEENQLPPGSVVYISDRLIWNGGLVDRLKGVLALYDYALENKIPFYIFSDNEYDFIHYLKIKKNILLSKLDRNLITTRVFVFIDNSNIKSYNNIFSDQLVNHVYTNLEIIKYKKNIDTNDRWRYLFNKLFKPTNHILSEICKIIDNRKYIVFSFRFRSRMGDFIDDEKKWDAIMKKNEVEILNKAVMKMMNEFPDHMIYIASDSSSYTEQISKLYPKKIFFNPNSKPDMNNMERSVVELLIISKGEKVFQFKRPTMYSGAFSKYASILGEIEYHLIML